MEYIKKIPVAMAVLILAIFSLGNLVQSYGEIYRTILGIIGLVLLLAYISKLILFRDEVKEELQNPVVASLFPALSMAIIIFSSYLVNIDQKFAGMIWSIGVVIHIVLFLMFTDRYVKYFELKNVYPSWFIVYVGLAAASITSPAVAKLLIGEYAFYFAVGSYVILLGFVIMRLIRYKDMPEATRATFAILAAPASLCLAAYLNVFLVRDPVLVYSLLALSQISYFLVLFKLPKILKIEFYPSIASLTYPLVITAISLKIFINYLNSHGIDPGLFSYLLKFEELVAVLIVGYVAIEYGKYLTSKEN